MFKSLASRLTALYTLLFMVLSLLVFGVIQYNLKSNLHERIDQEFLGDGREFVEVYQLGGLEALTQAIHLETESEGPDLVFIRLYSADLQTIETSDMKSWTDLPQPAPTFKNLIREQFETIDLAAHSGQARIFYQPLGNGYILQSGTLLRFNEELLANFQHVFFLTFAFVLLIAVPIGFYISRRSLAGIKLVRETADQISRGNLSHKISFHDQAKEVNHLITSINRMQSRIQTLIKELQDVSNNIAHDLRSPVTRIRGLAETTLSGPQSLLEYQGMSGSIIEECDSLVGMINTMLEIAETDAGVTPLIKEPVNISTIIRDVAELYSPVAEDKNIRISLKIIDDPLIISGDRSRLQRAFANLLDNALKFTQREGWIALEAKQENHDVTVRIADSGAGISAKDLPRIWERFYRADSSRSTPGTGLGLSLVQSIILAHDGKINITSTEKAGTQVTVSFNIAKGD
ncbi:ATP-binding protein [uncultured Desulfuromusa sp.]|uniref:sensor histidine kinase n=1 Tax=uncultured Desulfuromusa sp. TaxID=219183 RepID=UPI002AA6A149|nr:ATP-binding protein [uncultured Desulfuromusa sp.]